jgi:hypothetical protein
MLSRSRNGCSPWLRTPITSGNRTHGLEHARVEGFVERGPDSPKDAPADQIEHALRGVETGSENDEADEGRHAATRQHAVRLIQDFKDMQRLTIPIPGTTVQ